MSNSVHVALVKKGTKSVNKWRMNHPNQTLELSGEIIANINLENANLSPVCLSKAKLKTVNFSNANLAKSDLSNIWIGGSIFFGTNFLDADFSSSNVVYSTFNESNFNGSNISKTFLGNNNFLKVNFSEAKLEHSKCFENNFTHADFSNANLTSSEMPFCNFKYCKLVKTNFANAYLMGASFDNNIFDATILKGATIGGTKFSSCDLSGCEDLDGIKHEFPSSIDLQTIKNSINASNFALNPSLKKFLFSSGFPIGLIEQLPKIFGAVKYYSAFVSYGEPDKNFALKLREDLEKKGVSCWIYSLDSTVGKKTWKEISQKRREAEKMIILCSADALVRDGVLKEIEDQIDEDQEKIVPISLDNLWKHDGFPVKRGQNDLKPFLKERNYADFSTGADYKHSLEKLLEALTRRKK